MIFTKMNKVLNELKGESGNSFINIEDTIQTVSHPSIN